ncbi:hypothetical protein FOCC_FOCC007184 [Frankliniella occidentalis]|nr:hypothetical protein FOCC_FOCC007184 [Frankliniella occidentalis]
MPMDSHVSLPAATSPPESPPESPSISSPESAPEASPSHASPGGCARTLVRRPGHNVSRKLNFNVETVPALVEPSSSRSADRLPDVVHVADGWKSDALQKSPIGNNVHSNEAENRDEIVSEPEDSQTTGGSCTHISRKLQSSATVVRKLDFTSGTLSGDSDCFSPSGFVSNASDSSTIDGSNGLPGSDCRTESLSGHLSTQDALTAGGLSPLGINDNVMFFESTGLDLEEIFDGNNEGDAVILDLQPLNATVQENEEVAVAPPAGPFVVTVQENRAKPTRKRARHPSQCKIAIAKKALYAGEAHVNSKGNLRPAPTMRVPCACKYECSTKITKEERLKIFTVYNCTLGNKDKQWAYIRAHSTSTPVTKSTTARNTPQRKVARKYFFEVSRNGVESNVQVCKVMFMNTLSIWDGVIDSAYKHVNETTKTPTPDKRGKHANRPRKTTEEQRQSVKTHINSYPRIPSHYVRSRIQREYVENGLTGAKMYRHYREWCSESGILEKNRASKSQYRHILNFEFNIGFFRPKKDKCQLCALMKNGTRRERDHYKEAWVSHFNSKKQCYAEQKKARELVGRREDCVMLSFDLQKVLPCPKSDTSVFFYKNKLSLYNLTIYESRSHIGTCYLWHAGIAKRGANEIGSCVMKAYIQHAKEGKKEIYSFSDSCSGQNKNRYVYSMMLQVSAAYGVKIRHCFLTPGHTYNDADSVHARIENATKGKEIYDYKEWIRAIETAKENDPAYKVVEMKRNDFFDLKELVNKQNWEKNTDKEIIQWNKVRIIETDSKSEGILTYQYEIDGRKYHLDTNQRRGHPINLKTYRCKLAYESNVPLKALTIKHLQSLCKSLAIPSKYHSFYENVIANVEPTEDDETMIDAQVVEDCNDTNEILDDDGVLERNMANDREDDANELEEENADDLTDDEED